MNKIKNKLIISLHVLWVIHLITSPTFANSRISSCFSSLKQIIAQPSDLKKNEVKLNELEVVEKLGFGLNAEVFKVQYKNKEYAYRVPFETNQIADNFYKYLNYEEKMNYIIYRGRRIIPKLIALVKNDQGIIVGELIELIPGETLKSLVKNNKISQTVYNQIYLQIDDQIRFLHQYYFSHGDLNPENIMIDFSNINQIRVTLIDFDFDYNTNNLRERINKDLRHLFVLKQFKTNEINN